MSNEILTGYPSIDKPWLKHYSEKALSIELPKRTAYENIYEMHKDNLNDIALIYFGRKITYDELFKNVEKTKRALECAGVRKGDIVIMVMSSTPETVYSVLALCRIGAVANMINPFFEEQQIIDRANETNAKIMIVLDKLYGRVQGVEERLCIEKTVIVSVTDSMPMPIKIAANLKNKEIIKYGEKIISFADFIKSGRSAQTLPDAKYEEQQPVIMVYSSGTTGASKGIVLTNDSVGAIFTNYLCTYESALRHLVCLQMIPVWFSTGMILSTLMPLFMGMSTVLEPVFNEKVFVEDLKKYKPNFTLVATSLWVYASQADELNSVDLSFLKYPSSGGEKLLPQAENDLNEFLTAHGCKVPIIKGYGMCELGSTAATESITDRRLGSVGFPIRNAVAAAFDIDSNQEKKYYERGEIRVITNGRMKGYYKNPDATKEFFYTDENSNIWGCTGDVGYVDEDGFIYILGRANDSYISSLNRTVYCFDVEDVIYHNSDISRCKVIGIEFDGKTIPVAHIALKDDCNIDTEQLIKEIHTECVKCLDEDQIPCGYKIQKELPIKNSGKLDIELLKQDKSGYVKPAETGLVEVNFE